MSRGSVIGHENQIYVVYKVMQMPTRPIQRATASQMAGFTRDEARGRVVLRVRKATINGQRLAGQGPLRDFGVLGKTFQTWGMAGEYHLDGSCPTGNAGLLDDVGEKERMCLMGVMYDGTTPFTFSRSCEDTWCLWIRDWTMPGNLQKMMFPVGMIPKSANKSWLVGMLARDVQLCEQYKFQIVEIDENLAPVIRRLHVHMWQFISDRAGANPALGRLGSSKFSRSEWRGFTGHQESFGLGVRGRASHEFEGNVRIHKSVCLFACFFWERPKTCLVFCDSIWMASGQGSWNWGISPLKECQAIAELRSESPKRWIGGEDTQNGTNCTSVCRLGCPPLRDWLWNRKNICNLMKPFRSSPVGIT